MLVERNFYVRIHIDMLKDKNLTPFDKLVFALIDSLTKQNARCWASNKELANSLAATEKSVQNSINKLTNNNYIFKSIKYQGKRPIRYITTNNELETQKKLNNLTKQDKKDFKKVMNYDWLNEE